MSVELYGQYRPEEYKRILLERMQAHEAVLQPEQQRRITYLVSRTRLTAAFLPEVQWRLREQAHVSLLEIGIGEGNALKKLVDKLSSADRKRVTIVGTSLIRLPVHASLKAQGMHVYTGVLAERLPKHWKNRFDIVGTDSVLPWTDVPWALQEIHRVLKPGGTYFGIEYAGAVINDKSLPTVMTRLLTQAGMENSADGTNFGAALRRQDAFPIKYTKPISYQSSR